VLRRALIAVLTAVAVWLAACLVLFVWPPAESSPPRHADVVVVLSGDRKRLTPALALVRRGVAPVLAISTVERTKHWPEGRRLCRLGRVAAVRVLCFEAVPFSTQGEARSIARLARQRGWSSVVLVTSRFHVTRASMLFRRCYHRTLAVVGTGSTWWRLPEEWLSETGKLLTQLTLRRGC
jgi:uncharacterized SAM-binding protein YcdF (DUF218 family)